MENVTPAAATFESTTPRNSTPFRSSRASRCLWLLFCAVGAGCAESSPSEPESSIPVRAASESQALAVTGSTYVSNQSANGSFTLASGGQVAPLVVSAQDFPGVLRVAAHLQADVQRVTGTQPALQKDSPSGKQVILIGTLGKSPLIDALVQAGKLDVSDLTGKWDTFVNQVVEAPMSGVDRALVITGSNKRGTIYGMYNVSEQIGVSPWYYWADVPSPKRAELFVAAGRYTLGEPKVKYRGFFINDENPGLLGFVNGTFGGFNAKFYEKVFELVLRMKGNYLWPAMWGKSFNDDDATNQSLADEYGVVMGTSHHEPMMRAQAEWEKYGSGNWDYQSNKSTLQSFWEKGVQRMGTKESIVTVGMRGDGDVAGTANRQQLEQIIVDQRAILSKVLGQDAAAKQAQVFTLYKEVQDYYDQGIKVPDDVTIMFSDDNFGNVRKLPKLNQTRAGGFGVYYHYDYVGDPRNYKWINTNQIARVWEQMNLSYRYGAKNIWIVNVGDIKPMEFPTQFFLDFAWDPDKIPADRLPEYTRAWAAQQFGADKAADVADILTKYTRYNSRRKPELLAPDTYSQVNFSEAETIVADYNALADRAQKIYDALPSEYQSAFYQLVLYPVAACANLNDLYVSAGRNALYARQGRASANTLAARVKTLFMKDSELTKTYHSINGGKWNHMMDQTHIGYTDWQEPAQNNQPSVQQVNLGANAQMGVAIDGSDKVWPMESSKATLPEITPYRDRVTQFIDVFNRGNGMFNFTVTSSQPWLTVTPASGMVSNADQRLALSVDWKAAPMGKADVTVTITGPSNSTATVTVPVNNPAMPRPETVMGSVEANGYISLEAEHFSKAVETNEVKWLKIPDLGRTLSGMTPTPVTSAAQTPGGTSPHLEYQVYLFHEGALNVRAYISPTLNFGGQPLRYAVSFDDGTPQTVSIHSNTSDDTWRGWVRDNANVSVSKHTVSAGAHTLKFWMLDAGVVLQKLVVETGTLGVSYLGPPSTMPRGIVVGMGGAPSASGGSSGQQGTSGGASSGGAGGTTASNGGSNAGTSATGGTTSSSNGGGASTTAGQSSVVSGGNAGAGATSTPGAGQGSTAENGSDSGCGCTVPGRTSRTPQGLLALTALAGLIAARRRRPSPAAVQGHVATSSLPST